MDSDGSSDGDSQGGGRREADSEVSDEEDFSRGAKSIESPPESPPRGGGNLDSPPASPAQVSAQDGEWAGGAVEESSGDDEEEDGSYGVRDSDSDSSPPCPGSVSPFQSPPSSPRREVGVKGDRGRREGDIRRRRRRRRSGSWERDSSSGRESTPRRLIETEIASPQSGGDIDCGLSESPERRSAPESPDEGTEGGRDSSAPVSPYFDDGESSSPRRDKICIKSSPLQAEPSPPSSPWRKSRSPLSNIDKRCGGHRISEAKKGGREREMKEEQRGNIRGGSYLKPIEPDDEDDGRSNISSDSTIGGSPGPQSPPVISKQPPKQSHAEDLSDVSDIESLGSLSDHEEGVQVGEREESRVGNIKEKVGSSSSGGGGGGGLVGGDETEQLDFEAEEEREEGEVEGSGGMGVGGVNGNGCGGSPSQTLATVPSKEPPKDLEEGEISDEGENRPEETEPRPVCRFFSRGQCTWGSSCRFVHPGVTDKGNYTMFDMVRPLVPMNNGPPHMYGPMGPMEFHRPIDRPMMGPPPYQGQPSARKDDVGGESAWERGLRQAKELLRKSSKRKETEVDFEEKKMNLSLTQDEFDKENDYYTRPGSPYEDHYDGRYKDGGKRYRSVSDRFGDYNGYYPRGLPPQGIPPETWASYEERPARYSSSRHHQGAEYHSRGGSVVQGEEYYERKRHKYPSREVIVQRTEKPWKDDSPTNRRRSRGDEERGGGRGDEWSDPWMRSKSPSKGKPSGRSRKKSYSSQSSYSSSRSSRKSSIRGRSPPVKLKDKKKYRSRMKNSSSRSSSYSSYSWSRSGSRSSRSRSSRSRSRSLAAAARKKAAAAAVAATAATIAVPRRRSRRSNSAVGAAAAAASASSPLPSNTSANRRPPRTSSPFSRGSGKLGSPGWISEKRAETERSLHMNPPPPSPRAVPSPTRRNPTPPASSERSKGLGARLLAAAMRGRSASSRSSSGSDSSGSSSDSSSDSMTSSSSTSRPSSPPPPPPKPSSQSSRSKRLVLDEKLAQAMKVKAMDAMKVSGQKQQIKLTLKGREDRIQMPLLTSNRKRPAESPAFDEENSTSNVPSKSKKPAPSRREELLKQLKAVEDAIARKRSKI